MSFVLLLISAILFYHCKLAPRKKFFTDYLTIDNTNAIKGIFVICIFCSHLGILCHFDKPLDALWVKVWGMIGQLMVTMFLFYSGYGIMESIKRKGNRYIRKIPVRRFLRVLFEFDLAVILYLFLNYGFDIQYSIFNILLSFIAVETIGNPSWFILAILLHYLFTFLAFSIFKDYKKAILLLLLLSFIYILILAPFRPARFYNTTICYTAGVFFSFFREKFEVQMLNIKKYYFIVFGLLCAGGGIKVLGHYLKPFFHYSFSYDVLFYPVFSLIFTFFVLLLSLKIKFRNIVLDYLGKHIFSVYILQVLPMMILKKIGVLNFNEYVFAILSLILTLLISHFFSIWVDKGWRHLMSLDVDKYGST